VADSAISLIKLQFGMYDDFYVTDRWTKKQLHCMYQAQIVAIATRHADAVDYKFLAGGRPVWIALPCNAWAEYKRLTGHVITDPLAVQTAGRYLKTAIETGLDSGREMYTLTTEEMLEHLRAVLVDHKAPKDRYERLPAPAAASV
jgi:hypothetical protein